MHRFLSVFIFALFTTQVCAQMKPIDSYSPTDSCLTVGLVDTCHIVVPNEVRTASYIALAHYPSLQGLNIELKYANQKTTMSSRPKGNFIFKKRKNRTYIIRMDDELSAKGGILLDNVPFNAQVGVIGHELAHVHFYNEKSALGIIIFGFRYLFPSFRQKVEHETDEITIEHGLGYQLRDWADYVFNHSNSKEEYLDYKRKYYYTEDEIDNLIKANESYGL